MLLLASFDFPLELKGDRAFRETGPAGKLFYVLFVGSASRIKVSIILKLIKPSGGENELRRNCASDWVRVYI